MRNPELACDWCGDEVANGEGVNVYVNFGDGTGETNRVCSECAEEGVVA